MVTKMLKQLTQPLKRVAASKSLHPANTSAQMLCVRRYYTSTEASTSLRTQLRATATSAAALHSPYPHSPYPPAEHTASHLVLKVVNIAHVATHVGTHVRALTQMRAPPRAVQGWRASSSSGMLVC